MFRGLFNYTLAKALTAVLQLYLISLLSEKLSAEDVTLLGFVWLSNPLIFRLLSLGTDVGYSVLFIDKKTSSHLFISSVVPFVMNLGLFSILFLALPRYNFFLFDTSLLTRILFLSWVLISGIQNSFSNYLVLANQSARFGLLNALPVIVVALVLFSASNLININFYLLTLSSSSLMIIALTLDWSLIRYRVNLQLSKKMIFKGIYSVPGGLIVFVLAGFDRLVLEKYVKIEELALYVLIYKLSEGSISLISSSISKSLFPIQNSLLKGQTDLVRRGNEKVFINLALYACSALIAVLILLACLVPFGLDLVLESLDNFELGSRLFLIISAGLILNAGVSIIANNFIIRDKVREVMKFSVIAAGVNIILNILLIPEYGVLMAAETTLISYGFLLIIIILNSEIDWINLIVPIVLLIATLICVTITYESISKLISLSILAFSLSRLKVNYYKLS